MQAFKRVLLFPSVFDLIYFFWKMPYYTYFFFLKCHLRVKIQKFSLTHSEREDLIDYRINFSGSTLQNISFFLTQKSLCLSWTIATAIILLI